MISNNRLNNSDQELESSRAWQEQNWILITVVLWLDVEDATTKRNNPKETTSPDNPLDLFFLICENWFRNRNKPMFNLPEFSCN